jgi:signal transduction histidine kinase
LTQDHTLRQIGIAGTARSSGAQPGPRAETAAREPAAPRPHSAVSIDDTFFRHIVSGMRNGVIAITRDSRLALINDEAYRIFGVTARPGDPGRPLSDVLPGHPDVVRILTGAFDLHHLPNRVELRLKPSGRVIGYTLALVRNDAAEVIGATMFFRDLTRVEQLEERERLRDRLAALGEMAAIIAHEVKNPLAGIEVMSGLLRRKLTDQPDAQAMLTDIINEAKMANAIVQDVLDFVRPIRLQVEHTAIGAALRGAINLADTQSSRGRIDIRVDVPDGLPDIQADEHQLTQVFTNLLINAYEAMDGAGHIALRAQRIRLEDGGDGRDAVLVEMADDGPGMEPEVADKVFDPFFTTKAKGSGLGLAIVRKIVDAHDGRIDMKTGVGAGTIIRISIPVTAGDADVRA